MQKEQNYEIATTILNQLWGGKFATMTGAKNFIFDDQPSLLMELPSWNAMFLRIRLNENDLYDLIAQDKDGKEINEENDIDSEWLRESFCRLTWLAISL